MLAEIMHHSSDRLSRKEAIAILRAESRRRIVEDWILIALLIAFGWILFPLGMDAIVFLCAGACIATVSYRSHLRSARIAKAVLAILDEEIRDEPATSTDLNRAK